MSHAPIIWDIAVKTWSDTYKNILPEKQMDYMIEMMYNPVALDEQMNKLKHHFCLIKKKDASHWQGFVSYEYNYKAGRSAKVHKLYVLPECHGLGFGRVLINKVCEDAKENGNNSVRLNMNRNNATIGFYKHLGFSIVGEENIDIGNNYLMEDYVFEKEL